MNRILGFISATVDKINSLDTGHGNTRTTVDEYDFSAGLDLDEQEDIFIGGKKTQIALEDMDYIAWKKYLDKDIETLNLLLLMLADITPEHDSKLLQLIEDLRHKFANPINSNNKKVIIFTAFSDTAEYLYDCLAERIKVKHNLHTALITGSSDARSTVRIPNRQRVKLDFNTLLTLFSPLSKEKAALFPDVNEEIDVLIATDCISEGQNLQDCDYLINYDIHWNPVRIIQRFGRIDRIGSRNDVIQLVNYWPDMDLDEYIDLKGRVEARMKVSVMTSTGDDNPISPEEKGDLEYRREQLKRLQSEVVDIEEMNTGISIMDLGLNEFRLDLLAYMQDNPNIEHTPFGLHAVVPASEGCSPGAGVGERTREGNDLYNEMKESGVINKTALVYGQMNEPPGARMRVALSGLTMAEYFRDREGQDVLLFIDNIFRFTQAGSEVSALLGRMPSAVGYQMAYISPGPATVSAIRCIWNVLANPEKL